MYDEMIKSMEHHALIAEKISKVKKTSKKDRLFSKTETCRNYEDLQNQICFYVKKYKNSDDFAKRTGLSHQVFDNIINKQFNNVSVADFMAILRIDFIDDYLRDIFQTPSIFPNKPNIVEQVRLGFLTEEEAIDTIKKSYSLEKQKPYYSYIIQVLINGSPVDCAYFMHSPRYIFGRFAYLPSYLQNPESFPLDPINLPLKRKYFETSKTNGFFGVLNDLLPRGWNKNLYNMNLEKDGIRLIDRHVIGLDLMYNSTLIRVPQDNNTAKKSYANKNYIEEEELERYINSIGEIKSEKYKNHDFQEIVSPLHGMRAKIFVMINKKLYIAKFEEKDDMYNFPLVEYAMTLLAQKCGINVPEVSIRNVSNQSVFLSKYFVQEKIFFSLGTLLDLDLDGEKFGHVTCRDYQYEDVYKISHEKEVFIRLIFTLATNNIDDHAWNTGFLYDGKKLSLSPMYDMMPFLGNFVETVGSLGEKNIFKSLSELEAYAEQFGSSVEEIRAVVKEVKNWKELFIDCGVSEKDIKTLEPSFTLAMEYKV